MIFGSDFLFSSGDQRYFNGGSIFQHYTWLHEASEAGIHITRELLLPSEQQLVPIRMDDGHDGDGIHARVAGVVDALQTAAF